MEMFWFIQRFTYQFLWFRILLRFWITDVFVEALDRNFCGNGFFLFMSTFSKDHRHEKLFFFNTKIDVCCPKRHQEDKCQGRFLDTPAAFNFIQVTFAHGMLDLMTLMASFSGKPSQQNA
jgi:hypothetical protein